MNIYTERARNLRKNMTKQERVIWNLVRNHQFYNLEFKRQYVIGQYIVDFICKEKKIIIEIDGGQHNTKDIQTYDINRTEYLKSKGYKVIRFWNNDIDKNLLGVYKVLQKECGIIEEQPPPQPSP